MLAKSYAVSYGLENKQAQSIQWIDTHCHLDAAEFLHDAQSIRARSATKNVAHCIYPAVELDNFDAVRKLAHAHQDFYALGIHPLYMKDALDEDLLRLEATLASRFQPSLKDDRLVAVGEIGLDFFVPELTQAPLREKQLHFYHAQLRLARQYNLPVILHVRRSADELLKGLRHIGGKNHRWHGVVHAFNGSEQQALLFIKLGLKLGFGGAVSYERAQNLRHLASVLPVDAIVLETDSPDMPPSWLYVTAAQRIQGVAQSHNTPSELPRIGQVVADLRGITLATLAQTCWTNTLDAFPAMKAILR